MQKPELIYCINTRFFVNFNHVFSFLASLSDLTF